VTRAAPSSSRWCIAAAAAVAAFGVLVRVLAFARHPRLDLDEAMLALDVTGRSLGGLVHPLGFEQVAPILFLWISRISVAVGGVNEQTLRALPFVAGLAFVPCMWFATRRLIQSRGSATLAAAIAAVCPIAMFYADFFKPYAVDATVAAVLLWLVVRVIDAPASRSAWWSFGTFSVVAVFLSAPSVFVVASALAAIAMSPASRDPAGRRHTALVASTWALCAAVNFVVLLRSATGNAYMQHYWDGAFLLPPLRHMVDLVRGRIGWTVQETFLGDAIAYAAVVRLVLVAVGVTGVAALGRQRGKWSVVLFLGPVLLAAAASVLRLYPLSERTLLYMAPFVIVATVAGVDTLAGLVVARSPRVRPIVFATLAVLLLIPATMDSAIRLRGLRRPDSFRSDIADIVHQTSLGAPVYVFSRDVPVWTFYTTDWTRPDTARIRMLTDAAARTGPNSGNMPGRGHLVENEGRDLVVRSGGRVELVGIPTGMEARFADVSQQAPDPGWATNEAVRIRAAAEPGLWLFFTYCHNRCDRTLADTLTASGGRFVYERITRGARLYEYFRDPATGTAH
jgi:hypothetical protein